MKFAFIKQMEEENMRRPREDRFPVEFMCRMLEVTRQGFYAWKARGPSARARRDAELTEQISRIHDEHNKRYGSRRVLAELTGDGERTSRRRVRRLMRAAGLKTVQPRPYKRTTWQDKQAKAGLVDLVERGFVAEAPDQLWVGDITYLPLWGGHWAYLATVIDGCTRKVVGWAVADHMRTELVSQALAMALARRRPATGEVVFHSDRGSQYTSHAFRDFCLANGVIPSVGRTGSCFDNALAESFFATIKKELIHLHIWATVKSVKSAIFEYIESYYNRRRRHSKLGYLTPHEFELAFADETVNVA